MSYDALVWLLAGLGLGVAFSLMLLIGYAALEGGRLRRRLRKARAEVPVAVPAAARPVAVIRPAKSLLSEPTAQPVPKVPRLEVVKPVEPAPVRLAEVTSPVAEVAAPKPVAPVAIVELPKVEPAPVAPRPVQSVEAMFAEAFAIDRLTPTPEPDEGEPKA